jgi:hypothetical protein
MRGVKRLLAAMLCAALLPACGRKPEPPREEPKKPAPAGPAAISRDISIELAWPAEVLTLSPGQTRRWEIDLSESHCGAHVRVDAPLVATLNPVTDETRMNRVLEAGSPLDLSGDELVLEVSAPPEAPAGNLTGEILAEVSGRKGRLAFSVRVASMEVRVREAIARAADPLDKLPLGRLLASPAFERDNRVSVVFPDVTPGPGTVHCGRFALPGGDLLDLGRLESLGPVVDTSRVPGFTALELAGPPARLKVLVFSRERVDFVDLANFPASRGFALPGDCAVGFRGERVARISPDGTQALACSAKGKLTWHRGLDAKEPTPAVTVLEAGVENVWADAAFEHAVALFREDDGRSTLKAFAIADPPVLHDLPGSLISIREAWFCPESGLLLVAGPNPRGNSGAVYDLARSELKGALPESGWGRPLGFPRNSGLPVFALGDGFVEWDRNGGPPRSLRWTELPGGFPLPGTDVRFTIQGSTVKFARPK